MKSLVWVLGLLLALSFVVPDTMPVWVPVPTPPVTPNISPDVQTDANVVAALSNASAQDRFHVFDIYSSMAKVIKRDKGEFISTSEQFAKLQERALTMAIEQPGKYPGLDKAIEAVFMSAFETDDVVAITEPVRENLIKACEVIAKSAQ